MRISTKALFLTFALSVSLASPCRAWWDVGHMVVAAVAYDRLDPSVRAKILKLLPLNPNFPEWTMSAPPEQRDRIAFIHAATWADDIKGIFPRSSISQDGPDAGRNIGYDDHLQHDYWHFVDLPFAQDGAAGEDPVAPNALTQINLFLNTLSGDASDDVKSYDVVRLLHLIGDVHQPLHTVSRFSRKFPKGDRGGNDEKICLAFTCGSKLHAFWDSLLGERGTPLDAAALAAKLKAADPSEAAITDPATWVQESSGLAHTAVCTPAIGDGSGPFTLDDAYQAQAHTVAERQVALAGARLANVLNIAFGRSSGDGARASQ